MASCEAGDAFVMAEDIQLPWAVKPQSLTSKHRIGTCSFCGCHFVHHYRTRYKECPRHRLAIAMARMGYGWQDLVAKARISEGEARKIVFGKRTIEGC